MFDVALSVLCLAAGSAGALASVYRLLTLQDYQHDRINTTDLRQKLGSSARMELNIMLTLLATLAFVRRWAVVAWLVPLGLFHAYCVAHPLDTASLIVERRAIAHHTNREYVRLAWYAAFVFFVLYRLLHHALHHVQHDVEAWVFHRQ